jgi:hypothetical protein
MTVTNEGVRIELTESEAGTFFESGSAKISTDGGDLLKILAGELGKLPNKLALEAIRIRNHMQKGAIIATGNSRPTVRMPRALDATGGRAPGSDYTSVRICRSTIAQAAGSARPFEPQDFADCAISAKAS